jgi:hypothetical protein
MSILQLTQPHLLTLCHIIAMSLHKIKSYTSTYTNIALRMTADVIIMSLWSLEQGRGYMIWCGIFLE